MKDFDLMAELNEIGRLLDSSSLIDTVRQEVRAAVKSMEPVVIDGKYANEGGRYDLVVLECEGKEPSLPPSSIPSPTFLSFSPGDPTFYTSA